MAGPRAIGVDRARPTSGQVTPWVTWLLLAAMLAVFGVQLRLDDALDEFMYRWGLVAADLSALARGEEHGALEALVTLATSLFLHAGWLHLLTNVLYLGVFGTAVESAIGHLRYLLLFLGAGIAGGLTHLFVYPESPVPAIGASGAISGAIGAHLTLFPGATLASLAPVVFFSPAASVPAMLLLVLWVLAQALSGLVSITDAGYVAWWAHLGGFAWGVIVGTLVRPNRRRHW